MDPIFIHRPARQIRAIDRWVLQEILTEAKRSGNLAKQHLDAIACIVEEVLIEA